MRRLLVCLVFLISLTACAHERPTSVESVSVQTVSVGSVDIGYKIVGQGEPLLMIMGYAGTMDVWDPALVQSLAQSYQVILFDNRNMGYSSSSPETVTITLMAQDALGLLDALGVESAHVLGWSMGSVIAQEMVLDQPVKVDKLMLYGSAYEREPVMAALKRFDGLKPEEFATMLFPKAWVSQHPDIYSRLPSSSIPPTPEAINRQRQALAMWAGTADRLSKITNDTLLVVGEEDAITPLGQSLAMSDMIDGAWLVRFKNAGHWLMYQAPEDLASVVKTFIETDHNLLN